MDAANLFSASERLIQEDVRTDLQPESERFDPTSSTLHRLASEVDDAMKDPVMGAIEVGEIKVSDLWEDALHL